MARPFNNPMPLNKAVTWIKNKNAVHLVLLIETNPGPLYHQCLRFGKLDTVKTFKEQWEGDQSGLRILTFNQALTLLNSNVLPDNDSGAVEESTYGNALEDAIEDFEEDTIDTVEALKPPPIDFSKAFPTIPTPKPANSVAGANAIAELIQSAINQAMDVEQLKELANQKMEEAIRGLIKPLTIEVKTSPDGEPVALGTVHRNFPILLSMANARGKDGHRLNVLIHGPAGTSKSFSAKQVAQALGLSFYPISAVSSKFELFGFTDANGKVVRTPFREAWEHGGVLCYDELSASDENAFLSFNGALANGVAPFPDGAVDRHPDCLILAGDNVLGGATAEYNGRNKMDEATMDRFVTLEWPIDESLERVITGNDSWVDIVKRVRASVKSRGIKVLITPRASINGEALLRAGMSKYDVATATMRKGMNDSQWKLVCIDAGITI